MAFMTVNRVRLRSVWSLPKFAWVTWWIRRQARSAAGNLGVNVFRSRGLAFWTVTAWVDRAAMLAFRNTGPHAHAMPRLRTWFDEAAATDWQQAVPELPTKTVAAERLKKTGILGMLQFPSAAQSAGKLVAT